MAAFRRCVIALAVLAVFAGLASAQAPQPMTCNLSTQNATVRSEGKTELVSDLLMTCNGGSAITAGTQLSTVNFTLTLPAAITSRIVQTAGTSSVSDALLLIDDPGTVPPGTPLVANFGQNAPISVCQYSSNVGGCASFAQVSSGLPIMSSTSAGGTTGANVYQGIVNGSSVTFFGVPVLPPSTTGAGRTYRFTNVRLNASAGSTGPVVGTVTVQGGGINLITLNQTTATLGTVAQSLTVAASKPAVSISNCATGTGVAAGTVSFTELFASAFRTRVLPGTAPGSAQANTLVQNVPGSYFTESGYTIGLPTGSNPNVSGLADFGTRLKAIFNNVPSGVRVFVSFTNVGTVTNTPGIYNTVSVGANNSTATLAELVNGAENAVDTNVFPAATPTVPTLAYGTIAVGFPYVELTVTNGTATAVWEVLNTNTAANETATFAVWVTVPANSPTGQATVNPSYAPTGTPAATTVPGFVDPNAASPLNSFLITTCRSVLLYPFVTSLGGFDTGIAVSNTSLDTGAYTTTAQTGTCQFYLYGTPTPVPTIAPTPAIAGGTSYAFLLSSAAPGFTGYSIAVCNFQYAHGFAYVLDWASPTQSSAMGYLALILGNGTTRSVAPGVESQITH